MKHLIAYLSLAALVAGCSSSTGAPPAPSVGETSNGSTQPLGDGSAISWVKTDASGAPASMGVTFGDAALTGLGDVASMTVLPLPSVPNLPFDTVVINWNPQGHPPAGIYTVPHFDVHFYEIDEATRMAISPTSPQAKIPVPASLVAAGYVADPGGVVPEMGLHYLPSFAPEFHGEPFTATSIYGFWDGHDDFTEAMVARSYLQTHPSYATTLRVPPAYDRSGYLPTSWHLSYDASAKRFTIAMDGFVRH